MPVFAISKAPSALQLPRLLSCLYILPQRNCTSHSSSLTPLLVGHLPALTTLSPSSSSSFFCTELFSSSHKPGSYCIQHSVLHLGLQRDQQSTVQTGPLLSAQKEISLSCCHHRAGARVTSLLQCPLYGQHADPYSPQG